ncbi:MAG: hypothetical protein EOM73_14835 [Bacteroidia bacterium]|nr:hypothetical protein [Bacteroidia bacterium]
MNKIICAVFAVLFSGIAAFADDPQPMPKNTNLALQNKRQILLEVTAIQVVENDKHNGVVATYDEIWNLKEPGTKIDFWAGTWSFKKNDNLEDIFIVGLDHDTITTNGLIFHIQNNSNQHFLELWPIGIEKMNKGGRPVRLKKFTVNPKEAMTYYSQKAQKK